MHSSSPVPSAVVAVYPVSNICDAFAFCTPVRTRAHTARLKSGAAR
ncbi:hypothetical protein [Mycobacterium sp.]